MFQLAPLPFSVNALDPQLGTQTIEIHYGKHHQTYVDNLNKLVAGTSLAATRLEEIIVATANDVKAAGIFNNAAQVWNHSFYWECMQPQGGGKATGKVAELISAKWGSFEKFAEEFKSAGLSQFGSGWAWLVLDKGEPAITKTANADTPLAHGQKPLLTVDVWEHAYYLNYQNRRAEYLDVFIGKLINWDFVNSNL
ncbi:MAG: superoxide dismutase [Deltaproteobacteria bacterium]|nr:superoxide dismutase [Deltaproteobacteria bacterium]